MDLLTTLDAKEQGGGSWGFPYGCWDNLTACLCIYLAGMGNQNSFSLLPASSRRTPGSSTAGCDEGGRLQCQYQSRCSLPERRVLPCFKESVLCSRANHLLYAELSQCWLAASWKIQTGLFFFLGAHFSICNWIEVFKNGHIMQFGQMNVLDFSN